MVAFLIVASLIVVFRLGNQASAGVSLSDPVVWVEDGARGRILQINGSTREVTASVTVGEPGDSVTAVPRGRNAVFLNRTTGQLGVVGAISLAVDSEETVPGDDGPLVGEHLEFLADLRPSDNTNNNKDAYIIDSDRTLVFEPGAGEPTTILTPEGLGARAVDSTGHLVAVTVEAERLVIMDSEGRGLISYVDLPPRLGPDAELPGLARAGDGLFVVDAARRTVNEVLGEGELGATMCVAGSLADVVVGGNVLTQSTGSRLVLVHDADAGVLSVTNVAESDCYEIDLGSAGGEWGAPVAVDGTGYLPNYDIGEILIVDLEDRVVLDSFSFIQGGGRSFELEVFDGAVWANEPQGALAAIITRDEIRPISKIRNFLVTDNSDAGSGEFDGVSPGGEDGARAFGGEDGDVPVLAENADDETEVAPGDEQTTSDPGEGGEDGTSDDSGSEEAQSDTPIDRVDSPILVDVLDETNAQLDELIANFVFSADTANVGEEVSFSDESSGLPTSWNWDFGDGTGGEGPDVVKVWESEGVFTVTLFVANARGEQAQQSLDVTVVAVDQLRVPSANFSFRSDTIEVGESIEFTDTSTGDPDTLIWTFGDGATAAGPVVTHSFAEAGAYEVSLTASNAAGPNTTSAVITVVEGVQPPEAIIGPFPGVVEVGQTVTLTSESTNSPTAISWGFGDGDSALGTTVRHAWKVPGTYTIELSVSNSADADQTTAQIVVNARVSPPTARFGQSSLEVVQGEQINFNDLSLNNPDTLTWEFGDGSTAQGPNVSHSWDEPGTFRVTLTARNSAGEDEESKTVTVIPLPPDPPAAGFTVSSATVPVNAVVNFTNTTTGDPTEFSWDFGDGTTSTAASPPHGFSSPGTYEVTLTASNAGGSDSFTRTIVVVDPPTASFTRTVNELVVTFADTTTNAPTAWQWDFGDGTSSQAQNPTKTFAAAGTYTVTLIASNDAGSSAPFTATVEVASAPNANFTFVTGSLTAQFTDASTESPDSWTWDFGDGTTSAVQSPTHTYAAGGTYTVTLTVSNVAGTDVATTPVTVAVAPPVANIVCNVVGGGVACDGTGSSGAVNYAWTGVGSVATSGTTTPNASFTYATSGTYDITLTVENSEGTPDTATETVTVTVTPPPPVVTGITVDSNGTNGVVELTGVASNSPNANGWVWTTNGGGSIANGTTASPTITYTTAGSKTVTATASNAGGTSAPLSETFTVTVTPPAPVVTSVNQTETTGSVLVSTNTSGGAPTMWSWTVAASNEGSSTSANPTFTFNANGSFPASVTVSNGGGSDTFAFNIDVNNHIPPPTAGFTWSTGGPNEIVFANTSTAQGGATYTYNFGGGSQTGGTNDSPVATFPGPGTYTVTLMVTDGGGSDSFTDTMVMVS